MYRRILIALLLTLAGSSLPVSAYNGETARLLSSIDSALVNAGEWNSMKRHKISELRKKGEHARTPEERYWMNRMLFDEYAVYDADSALSYANRSAQQARQLGDEARIMEWDINRSFVLAATGLLKESQEAIDKVNASRLPDELQSLYFNQLAYLYSHYGQYVGADPASPTDYSVHSHAYQDSAYVHASKGDPLYLWYRGWVANRGSEADRDEAIALLRRSVDSARMDTRTDAMNAYILACLYDKKGDSENHIKYLAMSALCDVRTANKDIASLEELGKILFAQGEIDRAHSYVNFCQQQAQAYRNRVRAFSLAKIEKSIRDEYAKRDADQRRRMQRQLMWLAALSMVLIAAIAVIVFKNNRLKASRRKLSRVNAELQASVAELTVLRESQDSTNAQLKVVNTELSDLNRQLAGSNLIMEEYVGLMFSACSDYIDKLESFRKEVARKLKTNQLDSLLRTVDSSTMVQTELKEFYRRFDSIFLTLFPDFVKDFNRLLRPDEQIVLADGELLNTPLRIYALVRLGITDSVKIAALLHCSAQTVYNNRLRIRNKAAIPKETFAETVRTLGRVEG